MSINIPSPGKNLLQLPNHILVPITRSLSNRDAKNLRLTCKHLRELTKLRLERVFISPNPRNIEVFRAIAAHEEFRKHVVEIVWDDARLPDFSPEDSDDDGDEDDEEESCPIWFAKGCRENIEYNNEDFKDTHADDFASLMPMEQSYAYYTYLRAEQEAILESGDDIAAFRLGLTAFPALCRITICPVTHRRFLSPHYSTPMIRHFPAGFNYPIPIGWPTNTPMPARASSWDGIEEKTKWRGFSIVTSELTSFAEHLKITELVVDVNRAETGLNCHIFDTPSTEYNDFKSIITQPGFKRLDLAINTGEHQYSNWGSFRSGLLQQALALSVDLEHFYFHTNVVLETDAPLYIEIPLIEIFPVTQWPNLRHFGLSRFHVKVDDLISFLAQLPVSIQTIELYGIVFMEGDWRSLLNRIRDELGWQNRTKRPKLTIAIPNILHISGLATWLSGQEMSSFLYENGPSPFQDDANYIAQGFGMVKEDFDETYERPNVDDFTVMDLGYIKERRSWVLNVNTYYQ